MKLLALKACWKLCQDVVYVKLGDNFVIRGEEHILDWHATMRALQDDWVEIYTTKWRLNINT